MGEKLQVLGTLQLRSTNYSVEVNKPSSTSSSPLEVHIQSDNSRLELTLNDFVKLAVAISAAKYKLSIYKKL